MTYSGHSQAWPRFLATKSARQRQSAKAPGTDRGDMGDDRCRSSLRSAADWAAMARVPRAPRRARLYRRYRSPGRHRARRDSCRGIGPQAADAADPRRSALHLASEVTWMGAIDHVIGRIAVGRLVDLGNSDA